LADGRLQDLASVTTVTSGLRRGGEGRGGMRGQLQSSVVTGSSPWG
jgi:hypothetical protein